MKIARILGAIGRVMITAGALILLFVAYQLWGTGIQTARAQSALDQEFEEQAAAFEAENPPPTTAADGTDPEPEPPKVIPPVPPRGELVGKIEIPSIGVDWNVNEGVGLDVLKDGPGHYEGTPVPGEAGNASIAGHRTTYGQPFHNVDQLGEGDSIFFTYITGARFEYTYTGTEIVTPDRVDVLEDFGDNRITLTACHPKYSAAERIVVTAELVEEPAAPAPRSARTDEAPEVSLADTESIDGESSSKTPAVLWGIAAASVWLAAWAVARIWRKMPTYALALPVFLVVLFVFFENFSRLLPAAY